MACISKNATSITASLLSQDFVTVDAIKYL